MGVTDFVEDGEEAVDTLEITPGTESAQIERVRAVRARRDAGVARAALDRLVELAGTDANLVEPLVECAQSRVHRGRDHGRPARGVRGVHRDAALLVRATLRLSHFTCILYLLQSVADSDILDAMLRGSRLSLAAVLVLALVGAACSDEASGGNDEGHLRVVTTVSPITNIVQNVAGDLVDVTGIVPEGTNSHTFEPAPSDAQAMAEADVVFINGLHLEEPTRELADANVREGVEVVELGDRTITPDEYIFDFSFPQEDGDPNPHLWTHPLYAKRYAEIVADTLSELEPDNAERFAENAEAFATRLDELDALVREVTATVPPENRKLLTYHDSFPYFAREYGWTIIGAIQPSDFAEPTAQDVAGLIDQIRAEQVPAIFGSEVFPSPVLEQIAAETGADYIDDLRDDDLPGENGDPDHSYLALLVFDFRTFMGALGGDVSAFDALDTANLQPGDTTEYRS